MIRLVLTHPGGAHKDDFLAVCALIAETGAPIQRRDPTAEDLSDPTVAVVDIGGSHDAGRSNFDHHHFPREHPPTCALSLVLEHLGLYDDAKLFCAWLEPAEYFDSRGPKKTAEYLGVPRNAISQLNSPIDVTMLRRFAQVSSLEAPAPLYECMRMVGEDMLVYLRTIRSQLDLLSGKIERWSDPTQSVEALFLPRSDEAMDEPSNALRNYVRAEGLEDTIMAIVYPDRRGTGYGIARYEDHPRLDFSRLEDEADVHFAHKSGFMCKTSATDPQRLKALIKLSLVD